MFHRKMEPNKHIIFGVNRAMLGVAIPLLLLDLLEYVVLPICGIPSDKSHDMDFYQVSTEYLAGWQSLDKRKILKIHWEIIRQAEKRYGVAPRLLNRIRWDAPLVLMVLEIMLWGDPDTIRESIKKSRNL